MEEADRAHDLVECLPRMNKVLDLIHRGTLSSLVVDTWVPDLGGRGKRLSSSRSSSNT